MTHNYELDTLGDMEFYPSYKYSLRSAKCFDSNKYYTYDDRNGMDGLEFNDDYYYINYLGTD